jgi:hypothetical protein
MTSSALDYGIDVNKNSSLITIENSDLNDTDFFSTINEKQNVEQSQLSISEQLILNPFFVNINGGPLMKMENSDIYTTYKRVIVVYLNETYNNDHHSLLMEKYVDKKRLKEIGASLVFREGPMKLLKLHRKTATIVERNVLKQINNNDQIEFENDEIVICLFELVESDAQLYINSLFTNDFDFKKLMKVILLFQRYNGDLYGSSLKNKLCNTINNLKESGYWTYDYNCKLNMTNAFSKRTFTNSIDKNSKFQNKNTADIIKYIMENPHGSDYLQGVIQNVYQKTEYVDGASATKENGGKFKLYKIYNQNIFTMEQVTELFQVVKDNRVKYDLFNAFLLSKDYCHLVINNIDVLKIMKPTINKFMPLYKLLFGYAWICMYTEECVKKTRTTVDDRYIFSINTASELPDFPYTTSDLHTSPYISQLIAKDILNSNNNCLGLGQIKTGVADQNAIGTFNEFKTKFNIFTTGKDDKSIFDGLSCNDDGKWSDFTVSGSVITACVPKHSPLTNLLIDDNETTLNKMKRLFNEYYKNSDIDVICNKTDVFEFMDKVQELYNTIIKNLNEIEKKDVSEYIKIIPHKSIRIAITSEYVDHKMNYPLEYVVENLNTSKIRNHFYLREYSSIKAKLNDEYNGPTENKLYETYFKPTDCDNMHLTVTPYKTNKKDVQKSNTEYYMFLNDILPLDKQVEESENILVFKLTEGIKFKIENDESLKYNEDTTLNENYKEYLLHGIETFQSRFEEFFSLVSRFHLPCVRGFYCGNDVKLLPSCISAHKTGINIDYKYFAGKWDPIHIANKYRSRGFGTLFNSAEIRHLIEYNTNSNEWKNIFKIGQSRTSINNHLGPRKINDDIFKRSKYIHGLPDDIYKKLNYTYIETMDDLYDVYKERFGYDPKKVGIDLLKFKTIKEDGFIKPFNKSLLDITYELMA